MRKPGTRLPRSVHLTQGEADSILDAIVYRDTADEDENVDTGDADLTARSDARTRVVAKLISAGYEFETS